MGAARSTLASIACPARIVSIFEGGLSARILTRPVRATSSPAAIARTIAVMMPRMNGLQLAGSFTALRPEARVLYMTGYAEMPPGSDAAIVQKPFTMFALMEAVRRTLERSERNAYVVSPA